MFAWIHNILSSYGWPVAMVYALLYLQSASVCAWNGQSAEVGLQLPLRSASAHRSRTAHSSNFFVVRAALSSYLEAILNADIIIQTTVWVGSFRSYVSCSLQAFFFHSFILLRWQVLICSHSVMVLSLSFSFPSIQPLSCRSLNMALELSVYSIMFEHILYMHLALDNITTTTAITTKSFAVHSFTDFRFVYSLLSQINTWNLYCSLITEHWS